MQKGYTLIDVLIVVIILAILATIAVPVYRGAVRRTELREVKNIVELTRAGAKYYHLKYGITTLTTPANLSAVDVSVPPDAVCTYSIVSGAGGTRILEVKRESDDVLLYTYQLPYGPGDIKNTSDQKYLQAQDLP